jgi:phage terminase small subunit
MLTPLIVEGVDSIFQESYTLCKKSKQKEKYLMTFQNLLVRVPKWNEEIIDKEKQRIVAKSNCNYMEDIITCVHIIQLKCMTAMRVGMKQKKIDIDVPKLNVFIHKCYINVARSVYNNVYLYEIKTKSLEKQKNRRLVELLVQECILNTIRSNIPIEEIIRSYMDETTETDVIEKIEEEVVQEKIDLKTLEKEMEEVRQNELVVMPKLENIVESQSKGGGENIETGINQENTNNEVKDLIESMKQDSDILKNIQSQSPPTTPPSNNQDDMGSDSDTDSIVFDNDDEISLSGFDIQEI